MFTPKRDSSLFTKSCLALMCEITGVEQKDVGCTARAIIDPRHDKTCLRDFSTRPDTNRLAQPKKLASVLKFRL